MRICYPKTNIMHRTLSSSLPLMGQILRFWWIWLVKRVTSNGYKRFAYFTTCSWLSLSWHRFLRRNWANLNKCRFRRNHDTTWNDSVNFIQIIVTTVGYNEELLELLWKKTISSRYETGLYHRPHMKSWLGRKPSWRSPWSIFSNHFLLKLLI